MKKTKEQQNIPVQNVRATPNQQFPNEREINENVQMFQNEEESQQEENLPTNIKPIKLMVKFEPPLIGLLYLDMDDNEKMHIYNVLLNGIINLGDPEEITKHLFLDHAMFFNPKTVNFKQVENLIAKILEYFYQLAHLDENQLAQYYAMSKQNEDYNGDEEEDFQNISPVKVNKQKNKNQKKENEYEADNIDVRDYQNQNIINNVPKKKMNIKSEAHSD